jgi:hypothetical protein
LRLFSPITTSSFLVPSISRMPFTTAQLAARIRPAFAGSDLTVIHERIKTWARAALLFGGSPGRGGARIFSRESVLSAAVLNALAEIKGISVLQQDRGTLLAACSLAQTMAGDWVESRKPCWLEFTWTRSLGGERRMHCVVYSHVGELKLRPQAEATLTLDLGIVLDRLQWAAAEEEPTTADLGTIPLKRRRHR